MRRFDYVTPSGVTLLEGTRGQGMAGCPIEGFMWRHIKPIMQVITLATAVLVSFHTVWYWKTQQNVPELFIKFIPHTKLQLSDKNISTHIQLVETCLPKVFL